MKKKKMNFYLKTFSFLVVKFSIYLNKRVFVMAQVFMVCPVQCRIVMFGGSFLALRSHLWGSSR